MARKQALVLMIKTAATTLLVENQFFSKKCNGAPNTIYVFNVSDPYAYDPTLNETWPSFFRFHFGDFTVGDTDNCYVAIPGTACTTSLEAPLSYPYESGSTSWFDTLQDIDTVVPISANSHTYCQLFASNFSDTGSLLGFKSILLQANDFVCYDDHFKCGTIGNFSYFEGQGCSGTTLSSFSISPAESSLQDPFLGNISVILKTFNSASMIYDWWQFAPGLLLVPQFDMPFDYISAIIYLLSIIIGLYIPITTVVTLKREKKQFRLMNYLIISSQLLMVIWTILKMVFWLTVFKDYQSMAVFAEIREIFFNFGTFLSSIVSGIICTTGLFNKNKIVLYSIYFLLALVHIGTNGANYLCYYFNGGGGTTSFVALITNWENYEYFWFLTAFLQNTSASHKVNTLMAADKYLPHLFLGQLFAVGGYIFCGLVQGNTSWLKSDIAYQDCTGFTVFFMMIHIALSARINESMKIVSKFRGSTLTTKQSQSVAEETTSVAKSKLVKESRH
ncbi:hypothetical protein HDV06_005085 [Boothiomyces sp. JEL0866]|nr:hypothetical protein HDV06_005085 [Boothiomyces sp. JEL0866]